MKIFITGGAGFIGSHLTDYLLKKNNFVTVYDNFSSGKKEFIEHNIFNKNFRFIKNSTLNLKDLTKAMKDSDIVFHLAANPDVRIGSKNPELEIKQGYLSTFNVLEAMRLNDIKFIVYSSSSVVYGETNTKSISEDYSPLLPISLYGATKLGSEALINSYSGTFNFQSWIFRFANIVGSRGTHGIIVDLINKLKKDTSQLEILGNGKQCKPYLHVSDCVEGMICGQSFTCDGQNIFNLGCDSTTTVTKIAEILLEEMNLKDTKLIYTGGDRGWVGDIPRFKLNSKKMHKLGWKPKYTSDEAIRISIREILDNVKNVK